VILGSEGTLVKEWLYTTQYFVPAETLQFYQGTQTTIDSALNSVTALMEYIQAQEFHYKLTPDAPLFNSNSMFAAVAYELGTLLGVSTQHIEDALDLGPSLSMNPGTNRDVFNGMGWTANLTDASHLGYDLFDVAGNFGHVLIGGHGNDTLVGKDG